jgi:hypothetical protein
MSSTSSALRRRPVGMLQKSRIVTTGLVERVKVLLAFVLVFAGVTALGVASSGPAVAATAVVSETTGLNAIACPNTIICDAVGSNGRKGVVVPIVNGVVGNVVTVPGTRSFVGIACPSATICEAVGSTGSAGVVVPVTLADDGTPTPGTAVSVSGATALQIVACPSATTCERQSSSAPRSRASWRHWPSPATALRPRAAPRWRRGRATSTASPARAPLSVRGQPATPRAPAPSSWL